MPDWAQFAASDWSARFYDVPTGATGGGTDVTAQITSANGWAIAMSNGEVRRLRIEVGAPVGAASGALAQLSVRAIANAASETPAVDRVKTVWQAKTSEQPDVSLSAFDEDGSLNEWTGEGQLSPTVQRIANVWSAGETRRFALKIKNTGTQATAFALSWPALPAGWELKLYDALQNGAQLQGAIATPSMDAGQSVTWLVQVTANAQTTANTRAVLPIRASGGALFDEVAMEATVQSLAGLQWSVDNQTWTDVTPQTLIAAEQMDTIGVRALKSVPDAPWPDSAPLGPTWTFQGQTLWGETLWLHAVDLTGAGGDAATATLGKTLSLQIHVAKGDAFITYDTP